MTEGDPEQSREALLVGSCARSALNDHTTTLTSSSWRLRAEKPPLRPPSGLNLNLVSDDSSIIVRL